MLKTSQRELIEVNEVSSDTVDEDWIARFFSLVQDVSTEQMQILWSKVLAGEVKKPGSFSLKSLDFLRNVTAGEAALIETAGKYSLDYFGTTVVCLPKDSQIRADLGLTDANFRELAELGICYPGELVIREFLTFGEGENLDFVSGDHLLRAVSSTATMIAKRYRKPSARPDGARLAQIGMGVVPISAVSAAICISKRIVKKTRDTRRMDTHQCMIGAKLPLKLSQTHRAKRKTMNETITQLLTAKTAETSPGAFLINFKFDDASELFLDTRVSPARISDASAEASMMTMTSTPDDLIEMLNGRLDPIKSFMSGRIQIDGDMTIAMKLAALFRAS